MAERNPPSYLQAGSHPAENDRLTTQGLMLVGGSSNLAGLAASADMAVTANGTPNMSVNVAAGTAFVPGTENPFQGVYTCINDGVRNLVIAASDPTNPRIDLVVARVRDAAYSGAINAWALEVVQGTPAASPAIPATPANSIVLAQLAVAANAASIVAGNITDRRGYPSSWSTFTSVMGGTGVAIGNGTALINWRYMGPKTVAATFTFVYGSTTTAGTGPWSFSLPWTPKLVAGSNLFLPATLSRTASGTCAAAVQIVAAGTLVLAPSSGATSTLSYISGSSPSGAWAVGDTLYWSHVLQVV